jgi:hypothetical protein
VSGFNLPLREILRFKIKTRNFAATIIEDSKSSRSGFDLPLRKIMQQKMAHGEN